MPAKKPPFPAKTRLRYNGSRRLFADYVPYPILQQGTDVEILETAGAYSVYTVMGGAAKYTQVITLEDKNDWIVVGA